MKRFIENYNGEEFDALIIGGGISGAAVAYELSSRGLSVALVEKNDFGGATSSATSKLIHGGLRYLSKLEFGLVRESLKERRILENIAPNFVYPIPVIIPNYKGSQNGKWMIKSGMMLYDLLSYDKGYTKDKSKKIPRHYTLSAEEVLKNEPNIRKKGLTGAAVYYDCINIFPERLTLAFIKSAVKYGAMVSNYTELKGFIFSDSNKITGVSVYDRIGKKNIRLNGALTINCTGPWADFTLNLARKDISEPGVRRSEGIHIITRKLTNDNIVALMTPAGRHLFIIPWRKHSLIGTTDKEYNGNPDLYSVKKESIIELINSVNEVFGDGKLTFNDVIYSYGGLRPLVESQSENTYDSSRRYEIFDNSKDGLEGLITVEGGKYTTSRNLAETVMDLVNKKITKKTGKIKSSKEYLYGSEIPDIEGFIKKIIDENMDFDRTTVEYLGRNYGTEYKRVLEIARGDKNLSKTLNDDGEIPAQVVYAVEQEMAQTLEDIVIRRTGIGTLGNPGKRVLWKVAAVAAHELKWGIFRRIREFFQIKRKLEIPEK